MNKMNKRILSALLALILLMTNFPVISFASDTFAITYEGEKVTQVEFYEHERIAVTAENNPGDAYQWQIKIPDSEQWVNIQGQISQNINLSKAVVGSLSVNGIAYVRCAALSSGTETDYTAELCVTVKEDAPVAQIPAVQAPAAPVVREPVPTEQVPVETEAPVEETEAPVEPTEIPDKTEEIPAETAVPAEPEAEAQVTEPVEEPVSEPVEEAAEIFAETVAPTEAEESMAYTARAVQPFALRAAADDSSETETVTVTIHFRAVDRENKFEKTQKDATVRENAVNAEPVVDPYVAHIFKNSELKTTIPCHVIAGYKLVMPTFDQREGVTVDQNNKNNLSVNLDSVTENLEFYVYYQEVEVSYTARYFMQNVYNDLYVEDTTILTSDIKEKMKGYPGDEPNTDIIYPKVTGFTALFFQPDTIASDGSTIFEVYYDRNYYLMNFNMDGGYGTAPVYARYGTAFSVANPTKPGHNFTGWTEISRDINTDGSDVEDTKYVAELDALMSTIPLTSSGCVTKVPFSNLTYKATWNAADAPYSVAYWIQGDNGEKTYLGSITKYAPSGTTVTGSNDLTSDTPLCNATAHTHSNACMSCNHLHTSSCYGYLDSEQNPPDTTRLAAIQSLGKGEPEVGYIYAVDYPEVDWTWYNLYFGANWHCWHLSYREIDDMVSGEPLKTTTYTDSSGNTHEVRKYHAKWRDCNHVHDANCIKTCTLDEHTHGADCFHEMEYMEYVDDNVNTVTVKGDGSTVLNVMYRYKRYTLRFYYARSKVTNGQTVYSVVGGSTNYFGAYGDYSNMTVEQLLANVPETQWGNVQAKPTLREEFEGKYVLGQVTDGTTTYYYLEFTAQFNSNLEKIWPVHLFNTVKVSAPTSQCPQLEDAYFSAWNGEYKVKYTQDHQSRLNKNETIKGLYMELDENLVYDKKFQNSEVPYTDTKGNKTYLVSYLGFWDNGASEIHWSIPNEFRYHIMVPTSDATEVDGKVYKEYNNVKYEEYRNFIVYDNSELNSQDNQTAIALEGYRHLATVVENLDNTSNYAEGKLKSVDYYFYYTKNGPYTLNFWNHSGYMVDGKGELFYYGESLKKFKSSDNNKFMTEGIVYNGQKYGPYYPPTLEPQAYTFGGWYTTSECLDGTKVEDWDNMYMPDSDLTLYAKWEPVRYNTYFYMDYERYERRHEEQTYFFSTEGTPHGTNITADLQAIRDLKFKDENNVVNTQYLFVNWFYIDTDGTKKAFNPYEMAIRKELHLFAEWTSTVVKEYKVSYQQGKEENGEIVPVTPSFKMAEESKGYALEATTKTFTALSRDELTNFPDGTSGQLWLPHTNSHSIIMQSDNEHNVFSFYYITKEKAPYKVRYLDAATNQPMLDENGDEVQGGDPNNRDAIVTERFRYFEGYIPDAFHKRLVLSANNEENVITFYYTKDESVSGGDVGSGGSGGENPGQGRARYLIVHHYQKLDSEGYDKIEEEGIGNIGETVTVNQQQRSGFSFNVEKTKEEYNTQFGGNTADRNVKQENDLWSVSGVITSGEDENANKALELHLYYTRQLIEYTVRYVDWDTKKAVADAETKTAPFDSTVVEIATPITGYDLYDADENGNKTSELKISWNKESNVLTFYYIKKKVKVEYVPVCTDAGITSGFGAVSNPLDYDTVTPKGSSASATSGFNFLGWYTGWDTENRQQITVNKQLQSSEIERTDDVFEYTYYAVFEPITLTISQTKMNPGDSAVYEVVKDNAVVARVMLTGENDSVTLQVIPAGDYTVREMDNWTWTYTDTQTQTITVEAGKNNTNIVSFDYAGKDVGSCWLHNEMHKES